MSSPRYTLLLGLVAAALLHTQINRPVPATAECARQHINTYDDTCEHPQAPSAPCTACTRCHTQHRDEPAPDWPADLNPHGESSEPMHDAAEEGSDVPFYYN